MRIWVKFALLLVVVAALSFTAYRLAGMFFQLVDGVRGIDFAEPAETAPGPEVETQPPMELTDDDYDAVQGVREY